MRAARLPWAGFFFLFMLTGPAGADPFAVWRPQMLPAPAWPMWSAWPWIPAPVAPGGLPFFWGPPVLPVFPAAPAGGLPSAPPPGETAAVKTSPVEAVAPQTLPPAPSADTSAEAVTPPPAPPAQEEAAAVVGLAALAERMLALAEAQTQRRTGADRNRPLPAAARSALEAARRAAEKQEFMMAIEQALAAMEAMQTAPPARLPARAQPSRSPAAAKPSAGAQAAPGQTTGKRKLCWKNDRLDVCP